MADDLPDHLPFVIETITQAIALGPVLGEVLHYDAGWAEKVFQGTGTTFGTSGPAVLNNELRSAWANYWTRDEKRRILAGYVAARLDR